jgi:hypothetical protein
MRFISGNNVISLYQLGNAVVNITNEIRGLLLGLTFGAAWPSIPELVNSGHINVPDLSERVRLAAHAKHQLGDDKSRTAFFNKASRVRDLFSVLIRLDAGGPARLTEQLTDTYRDTPTQAASITLAVDTVCIRQTYIKTHNLPGQGEANILRFLDKDVATLLVVYLSLVRPIEAAIRRNQGGDNVETVVNEYLVFLYCLGSGKATADHISRVFSNSMRDHGVSLNVQQYRHVHRAFSSAHLKGRPKLLNESLLDEQEGHSDDTALQFYAVDIGLGLGLGLG